MALSFEEVQAFAKEMKAAYSQRDTTFEEMDNIFLMENADLPTGKWIKETIDSTGRDKLLGAVRLLTAADPIWSVPRDKNSEDIEQKTASDLEKAAGMMWTAAGRAKKTPVHYTAVLAGLLYGQADIAVIKVEDLIKRASSPAQKKRLEKIAMRTPIIWEALNPKLCYPVFDGFGLAAHLTSREMKVVDVRNRFNEGVLEGKKNLDVVVYNEYWDLEKHVVWVDGESAALLDEEHDLPMIPVASARMEGSELFEDDFQHQPFLYTMYKGNTYKRASLLQTVMFTNLFTIGANPGIVHHKSNDNTKLVIDFTQPGGVIEVPLGDKVEPFNMKAITPEMQQMYDLLERKIETSTIYAQTLGEPLGANAPFSMVHLLSQAGRLPLVPYQRMLSNLITDAMSIGLEMLRSTGGKLAVKGENKGIELDLNDIPEDVELRATLDISMPQDKAQDAKTAIELNRAGYISMERGREEYLGIGQSDDEQTQIWTEIMAQAQFDQRIQAMMQQAAMQAQQGQMTPGAMPPGMPQGQQMPPEMGQMPPMDPSMLDQTNAQPGLPLTQGQPPINMPNPDQMMPPGMPGGM